MATVGHLAMPCERNSIEQNPIQEMLRRRNVDFLNAGKCPGYQGEGACYGPWLEWNVILRCISSSLILGPFRNVHNPSALFYSKGAVDHED